MKRRFLAAALSLLLLAGCATTQQAATAGPGTLPTEPTVPETTVPAAAASTVPKTEETTVPTTEPETVPVTEPTASAEGMKAMWLSQYDLSPIYQDGGSQRERGDFTARMEQVLDNVADQGFNTVILQVRPNADSMYPSEYYPMSKYVVGQYGKEEVYDPVEVIVALAHSRGLEIHAWINPMRAMSETEMEQVPEKYLIRQWAKDAQRGYMVLHGSTWYLNPAYEPVRQLIVDGAREVLARYGFDGLHMDDYFYPTTDAAFDQAAYGKMGGGTSLADFRRQSLNKLVAALYDTAHGAGKMFGISPAGNIKTVYESQYADVYTWCGSEGYLDYICPQVYFGLEHQNYDFVSVCETYQSIIKTDAVSLVVGMTFGKALSQEDQWAGTGKNEWKEHRDVLKRCLETTTELPKCRGVAVFCYQYFFDPLTGEEVSGTQEERDNFVPVFVEIGWG